MTREEALPYVTYALDDSQCERSVNEVPDNARLVGWTVSDDGEPMFVAVWSYLPGEDPPDRAEAEELAFDLLIEKEWFIDNAMTPCAPTWII